MMDKVDSKPTWATANPKRRKSMAPRIVEMAVMNTANVPSPFSCIGCKIAFDAFVDVPLWLASGTGYPTLRAEC